MAIQSDARTPHRGDEGEVSGPWDPAVAQLRAWDPTWTEICSKMATNPWRSGVLPRKTVELIGIALNAACTNLNPDGTRRHIRAALEAGATRDEILMVLKMRVGDVDPLLQPGRADPLGGSEGGRREAAGESRGTNASLRQDEGPGPMESAWDPFFELDPVWTDEFMAMGIAIYASGVMSPKEVELLSIAFDASYTHMYAPGTRRHIKAALKLGATMEEIMEVLKLCVVQGVQATNLGVPILAEEIVRQSDAPRQA